MCKSMFSLFCLDNLFLPQQKPVQEQRDTLEPKHLHISFDFAVAVFPRYLQQALYAVFGSLCYPTVLAQYLLACRAFSQGYEVFVNEVAVVQPFILD